VLYQELSLFRKGVTLFADEHQPTLDKYLLKSVCTDIVNLILSDHAAQADAQAHYYLIYLKAAYTSTLRPHTLVP
jgi:hypothetical protein